MYNPKQKDLIRTLFRNLAIITLGVKYKGIKLKILYNRQDFINRINFDSKTVSFNYHSIAYRSKWGYSDSYYIGRANKIDKVIHKNKKNCIRFVLLHELYHAKKRYCQKIYNKKYPLYLRGKEADDFAINTIKNGGLL